MGQLFDTTKLRAASTAELLETMEADDNQLEKLCNAGEESGKTAENIQRGAGA